MFLDSDVRVLDPLGEEMNWSPGLTARTGTDLVNHMQTVKNQKEIEVIKEAAPQLNIELQQLQWLGEFMFAIKRQNGLEKRDFFQFRQTISDFFERQGIYHGESYTIGLAAARVGMTFDFCRQDKFPFFNDKIELIRIKNGQSNLEDTQIYFDIHKQIEYPKRSLWQKITNRLIQKAVFYYRLLRLRIFVKKDPNFSKIFG